VSRGVNLTVLAILNLWEKKEKIRSIVSCVTKFISTSKPRSEYDMPYSERNVRNSTGERFPTTDIEMFVV
jgi:hypothetical protein